MLNLKFIIENLDKVIQTLNKRKQNFSYLKQLYPLYNDKKSLIVQLENKRHQQNKLSKDISKHKNFHPHNQDIINQSILLKQNIIVLENDLKEIEAKIFEILANIPNLPHESVIDSTINQQNKELYRSPHKLSFNLKDHIELGENLNILDFQRASKITGSRFVVYKNLGARLERALIQFMMDLHSNRGYQEIIPPFIINSKSMFATGQLPKFKNESYKLENNDWYLNPTGEIPAINLHREEILSQEILPLRYVVFTTCFRQEAGAAGKDTRGILRQHQFNKVELISFTEPQNSYLELDKMLKDSEEVLKQLHLPYRIVSLSPYDLGFSAAKTYDIEVWLPGTNNYREIASISNTEAFQALRANIKFKNMPKPQNKVKNQYVHILNGSGLAVGRTVIAILENYQNIDGTITVPKVLQPYMHTKIIK